jgi:GYF domain 2
MTGTETEIQWYIAREGKQYGPLNDAELRMFIAGGHLRPTDLVWRPGMADWRQANSVFSLKPAPAALPPPTHDSAQGAAQAGREAGDGGTRSGGLRVDLAFPEGLADRLRAFERFRIPAIAAAAAVIVVAGWVAMGKLRSISAGPGVPALTASAVPAKGKTAPRGPVASNPEAIDASFQRTMLWSVVKREFPDWYGERLKETAKLSTDNKPEDAIAKHLVEALVALRRKNADHALAASTPKLKAIASAFLENLKKLNAQSTTACYSFISQLEAAPAVIELLQQPELGSPFEAQVAAVFEAIADGRKSPTQHVAPKKTDYDALADQLTKLGWSQADLQLFADPRALARTSPERVCKMVQDWFSAHIAITDLEAQERLLVETLKPVVAG